MKTIEATKIQGNLPEHNDCASNLIADEKNHFEVELCRKIDEMVRMPEKYDSSYPPSSVRARYLNTEESIQIENLMDSSNLHQNEAPQIDIHELQDTLEHLLAAPGEHNNIQEDIGRLIAWVSEDAAMRIELIERTLAERIDTTGVTLPVLALLGRLQTMRDKKFIDNSLAEKLELGEGLKNTVVAQLRCINRVNDRSANRLAMKVWDFAREYIRTIQDHVEQELEGRLGDGYGGYYRGLCMDLFALSGQEIPYAQNYLVQKELQEVRDAQFPDDDIKEGALSGVGGGATDETIYVFRHLHESYTNRRALGINEGYPVAQPVLKVAPGLYGFFNNGSIEKIFSENDFDLELAKQKEQEYLNSNHPEDDQYDVYEEVNNPWPSSGRYSHPSNKLQALQEIWYFEDRLKDSGRSYFYNISKFDHDALHPMVDADSLSRNFQYLHRVEGEKNRSEPLKQGEFERLLSPDQQLSTEDINAFRSLTSLPMRKKIEEDFGIVLADLNLRVQFQFLNYLEGVTTTHALELMEWSKKYGLPLFRSFLSLESNKQMGESILAVGRLCGEETARAVFQKYDELIQSAERTNEYLAEALGDRFKGNERAVDGIVRALIDKANCLIEDAGKNALNRSAVETDTLILNELEAIDSNLLLLSNTLQVLKSGNIKFSIEEFRDLQHHEVNSTELTQAEKDQMLLITDINWREMPAMHQTIIEDFKKQLSDPASNFFLVEQSETVIGFFRLDQTKDGLYFGSVNTRPDLRGKGVAEAMFREVFKKEADGNKVIGHCSPKSAVSTVYNAKLGFIFSDLQQYKETGEWAFEMIRDDSVIGQASGRPYQYLGRTYDELATIKQQNPEAPIISAQFEENHNSIQYQSFIDQAKQRLDRGEIISAFQRLPKTGVNTDGNGHIQALVAFEPKAVMKPAVQLTS